MLWTPRQKSPPTLMQRAILVGAPVTAIWKHAQLLLESFANRELWLRACTIASLRERDVMTLAELPHLGRLGLNDGCARVEAGSLPTGGGRDALPQFRVQSADHCPGRALVPVVVGSVRPRATSKEQAEAIGAQLDRRPRSAISASGIGHWSPRWGEMSSLRTIVRRLQQRAYQHAAILVVIIARVLAREGLLGPRGCLIAARLSSRLSKWSWAIFRSERALRKSRICQNANECSALRPTDQEQLGQTKAGFEDSGDRQ